jgi:hypothetical protein
MPRQFSRDGIRWEYPLHWAIEDDQGQEGWTVTLMRSPTAWVIVTLRAEAESTVQVLEETLAAFRSDYPQLDVESVVEDLAGGMAVGHDMELITVDTAVTCQTRCIETPLGPLLLLAQCDDSELEDFLPERQAIFASLAIDDEVEE